MTTWVPKFHIPIMIIGTASGENKIVVSNTGDAFTLSPTFNLKPLDAGVVLLCNVTLEAGGELKCLVYDGERLPPSQEELCVFRDRVDTPETFPSDGTIRYKRLLEFFPHVFGFNAAARSTFVLQWVGFFECAQEFLSGKIPVPHAIGGLLTTTGDPLCPTRPVIVKIPTIEIGTFQGVCDTECAERGQEALRV